MFSFMNEKKYLCMRMPLLVWYQKNARDLPWRRDKEPYHIWVSEVMLQQTRVEAVTAYYTRFLQEIPTMEALARVSEQKLYKLWEGLGYYARAKNLQKAAIRIIEEHGGCFPEEYDRVLALPGIGEYTAGAICSICFDQPTPAMDGNVLRVLSRFGENFGRIDDAAWKKEVRRELASVYPAGRCGEFTQSLMELGATVCLPGKAPLCALCPVSDFCRANKNGTQSLLPVRSVKRPRRVEEKTVFLLAANGRIALRKRPEKGLLAALWELPNLPGKLGEAQALEAAADWGADVFGTFYTVERTHIFTHVEWHMICYYLTCRQEAPGFVWANTAAIEDECALPTAFRMFLEED